MFEKGDAGCTVLITSSQELQKTLMTLPYTSERK